MLPIIRMKVEVPTAEVLPPSYESRIGAEILKKNYDVRKSSPIYIIVRTKKKVTDISSIKSIKKYEDKIQRLPGLLSVQSFINVLGNRTPEETFQLLKIKGTYDRMENQNLLKGNFALLTAVPRSNPNSAEASNLVHQIRKVSTNDLELYVTGQTALLVDIMDRINSGLPLLMLFIISVTYLILLYAFKSVLIPLKAVMMNVLSLGASLGIVVIIFQYGWLTGFLKITSTGYVSIIMPVTIFCIVFGISMDYEVF